MDRQYRFIQSLTGKDDELVLQFFVTFSRFEYALKQARFIRADRNDNAFPDWQRFARERLAGELADIQDAEFIEAKSLLLADPPQKQIIVRPGNYIQWQKNTRRVEEDEAEYVLRLVRDVRNNLFHGGKYPDKNVSGQDLRNHRLLKACLTILETCLSLDKDVKHYFEFLHDE